MPNALRLASGRFGRVALLDMDRPLVRHAHPRCHVLLKVEGADTRFSVGERTVVLTNEQPASSAAVARQPTFARRPVLRLGARDQPAANIPKV